MSARSKQQTTSKNVFGSFFVTISSQMKNIKEGSASGYLKPALILVVIVLIASILVSIILPKGGTDPILYVKDGELYFATASSTKGKAVTSGQINSEQSAVLTADGKGIFYKDQQGDELCYKRTDKLKKSPTVLSKDVFEFSVSTDNSVVTYVKGIERELYQHDLKKQSELIDKNIVLFYVSDDANNIIYTKYNETGSSEIWIYKKGTAPKLIVADYDGTYNIADDCLSLIYTKDGTAYRFKDGKDDEKLIDNCSEIISCYDSGEIYYCHYSGENGALYPSLYYFNGKKSEKIADSYSGNISYAAKAPVLIYYSTTDNGNTYSIAVNGNTSTVEHNISSAYVKPDGDEVYFITDSDPNTRQGTLYKASISSKTMKKAKEIDKDVYRGKYLDSDKFIYFKNYELGLDLADLYLGKKKIAEKVGPDSIIYNPVNEDIIYFTDVDTFMGTLNIYGGGNKKVAEKVHVGQTFITENGNIVFIKDFVATEGVGDLYICKSRKGKKIGENVSSLFKYDTAAARDTIERGYY